MNMHHTTTSAVSIRQKVEYTGDMANPSGRGAIVDMSGFSAVVILDDGRTITYPVNLIRHISERQRGDRILALDEIATAAEILELQAGKVALEAAAQAGCLAECRRAARRPEPRGAPARLAELPRCRDPHDQKFLELARAAGADALVTKDRALLELAPTPPWHDLQFRR